MGEVVWCSPDVDFSGEASTKSGTSRWATVCVLTCEGAAARGGGAVDTRVFWELEASHERVVMEELHEPATARVWLRRGAAGAWAGMRA
jgi:hypothetical protein